jgi:biopolymer transport protein ExbD
VQFRRQKREEDSVNLTPLIDVVFLLLIFFMVSTTFTKETHLKIDLPEAVGDAQQDVPEFVEVLVDAEGNYSVNGKPLVNAQVMTLRAAVDEVGGGDSSKPFIITADANTPHKAVVTVMDVAGQLGYVNLSITTKNPAPN